MLGAHDTLRDPTVDELHNGPGREALPERVQQMTKSDTVCSFCGVSYLVFSEIKELEKKLVNALADSSKCRRLETRVKEIDALNAENESMRKGLDAKMATLKDENASLQHKVASCNESAKNRQEKGEQLTRQLAESEEMLLAEQCNRQRAEEEMGKAVLQAKEALENAEKNHIRCHHAEEALKGERSEKKASQLLNGRMKRKLGVIQTFLQLERSSMAEIRQEVKDSLKFVDNCISNLHSESARLKDMSSACVDATKASFDHLSAELLNLSAVNDHLSRQVKELENHRKSVVVKCTDLQKSLDTVQHDLQQSLAIAKAELQNQIQTSTQRDIESAQIIAAKDGEMLELKTQLERLRTSSGVLNDELQDRARMEAIRKKELEIASSSLQSAQNEYHSLKLSAQDMQAREAHLIEQHQTQLGSMEQKHACDVQQLQCSIETKSHEFSLACEVKDKKLNARLREMHDVRTENQTLRTQMVAFEDAGKEMKEARDIAEHQLELKKEECNNLTEKVGQLQNHIKDNAAASAGNHDIDRHGLEGLERCLIKLSGQVRQRDKEVQRLEGMVHRQCEERMLMIMELNSYKEVASQAQIDETGKSHDWKGAKKRTGTRK
jgi:hypothetical protein